MGILLRFRRFVGGATVAKRKIATVAHFEYADYHNTHDNISSGKRSINDGLPIAHAEQIDRCADEELERDPAPPSKATVARRTLPTSLTHEHLVECFVDQRLMRKADSKLRAAAVYQAYVSYCVDLGFEPASPTMLGRHLRAMGIASVKRHSRVWYDGLALRKRCDTHAGKQREALG